MDMDTAFVYPIAFDGTATEGEVSEQAQQIVTRCVLTRGIFEVWGEGKTFEELIESVQRIKADWQSPYCTQGKSWRWRHTVLGGSVNKDKLHAWQQQLQNVYPLAGPVDVSAAENTFWLILDLPRPKSFEPSFETAGVVSSEKEPLRYFFAREVARTETKQFHKFDLKQRAYIGPTSTDANLCFLMSNLALVKKGSVVFDPFVGTGSILVSASYFGAFTMGFDLDWKIMHGKLRGNAPDNTCLQNFQQYKLPYPELICADSSMPAFREGAQFDAIICDPPYGVRAGAKRSGTLKKKGDVASDATSPTTSTPTSSSALPATTTTRSLAETYDGTHCPPSQPYAVDDLMCDLLDMAADKLFLHGRLVYLLPVPGDFQRSELPEHPLLRLVAVNEQVLRQGFSRLCVTMEKVEEHVHLPGQTKRTAGERVS